MHAHSQYTDTWRCKQTSRVTTTIRPAWPNSYDISDMRKDVYGIRGSRTRWPYNYHSILLSLADNLISFLSFPLLCILYFIYVIYICFIQQSNTIVQAKLVNWKMDRKSYYICGKFTFTTYSIIRLLSTRRVQVATLWRPGNGPFPGANSPGKTVWDGWIPAGPLTLAMSPVPPVFHTSYALAVYTKQEYISPCNKYTIYRTFVSLI